MRQAHLDKVFAMRSQQYHSERAELLARYEPYLVRDRVDGRLYSGADSGSEVGLPAGSRTGSRAGQEAGPETGPETGSRADTQAGDPSEDRNRAWTNTQTRDPTEAWTGTSVKPQQRHDTAVTFRVNINSADIDSLILLPGIGPAYARRIIDRRLEIGGFTDPGQLLDVKGIGPARFEKIQPFVEL